MRDENKLIADKIYPNAVVVLVRSPIARDWMDESGHRFAQQCLTTTSDNLKCQYLALILKNELSSLLPLLQNFSDEETIRIYREASELEDANIKRLALMYLQSKLSYQDPFLLKIAKSAVYTLDSYFANFAANILRNSNSAEEKSLGAAFEKGKDLSLYTSFSKGIDLALWQWQVEELKPLQSFAERRDDHRGRPRSRESRRSDPPPQ